MSGSWGGRWCRTCRRGWRRRLFPAHVPTGAAHCWCHWVAGPIRIQTITSWSCSTAKTRCATRTSGRRWSRRRRRSRRGKSGRRRGRLWRWMAAYGLEFVLTFVHPGIQSSTHVTFLVLRVVLPDTIVQSIPVVVHDSTCSPLTFLEGVQSRKVVTKFVCEEIPQIMV